MGIIFDSKENIFHLQAADVSYAIQIYKEKYPVHLYWGKRIRDNNFGYLVRNSDAAFSPNPDPEDLSYSLDLIPLEYPAYGNSDFRSPAFSVQLENGTTVSDLVYKTHRIFKGKPELKALPATYTESDDEAESLEIELFDNITGLTVELLYTIFENSGVIARSAKFINKGCKDLRIQRIFSSSVDFQDSEFEMLQLSGAWAKDRQMVKRKLAAGTQSIESRRGVSSHQQNPFLGLFRPGTDEKQGDAYGMNLVYSGNFIAGVEVDQFNTSRAFIGINHFDFSWLLKPEEEFQAPEAVMVYSSEGIGGMSRKYHKLYRTRLCRGTFRDKTRPVLINNWEATYFDFNADKIEAIAKAGKELGIELMVLDDGWFGKRDDDRSSLGDWYVDMAKLPGGLKDLAQRVNNLGMKFGLWFEPEMVSPDSELYRAHPDWCIHVPDRKRSLGRHQLVLDFSREEVRNEIVRLVSNVLSSAPISYVKWDFNRHLTEIGSAALPPERQRETAHRFILGVYEVMDKITSSFPDILFESCSGGGGRFDPGMLYYMPQVWTSDNSDAVDRLRIQYGTSIAYPSSTMGAHVSAVPNHQSHRVTPFETRGNVAMSGNFGYELDLTKLTDEEKEMTRQQVIKYKELRELIQFGEMYRLNSPFEGNETAWMFVSENKKEAFIGYFKVLTEANGPMTRIYPRGLDPDKKYRVIEENMVYSGDMLMYAGLNVPKLTGDFASYTWKLVAE